MTGMGHSDHLLDTGSDTALPLNAPVSVVAEAVHVERLKGRLDASWVADANTLQLPLTARLPVTELPHNGVIIVQVDPSVPTSMQRIAALRSARPEAALIAAMETVDLKLVRMLVREGVADVVGIPFEPEEIFQTLVAVLETTGKADEGEVELAPVIAVTRALGGAGATTVASHLAASLAEHGSSVCLIDLDIQFGRLADVLGLKPRRNLSDLLEAGDRLDRAFLGSVAAEHSSGISVIAPPSEILPMEALDYEALSRLIYLAQAEYDYVVLDLPVGMTNWILSVLAKADSIILVTQQTLESLRQSRRKLDLFRSLGLDPRLISVVVNRVEKRLFKTIGLADVAEALKRPVSVALKLDEHNILAAQDQGRLMNDLRPKSPFVAEMRAFSDRLHDRFQTEHDQ